MTSAFGDPAGRYSVLANDEGQCSLWPAQAEVPAGWETLLRDRPRPDCLAFVEQYWTDMRPRSLQPPGGPPH